MDKPRAPRINPAEVAARVREAGADPRKMYLIGCGLGFTAGLLLGFRLFRKPCPCAERAAVGGLEMSPAMYESILAAERLRQTATAPQHPAMPGPPPAPAAAAQAPAYSQAESAPAGPTYAGPDPVPAELIDPPTFSEEPSSGPAPIIPPEMQAAFDAFHRGDTSAYDDFRAS